MNSAPAAPAVPVRGPLFADPGRKVLTFWASLAALNLAAGVVVSSQTHRLYDLESMMRWGRSWLVDGMNIYQPVDSGVDYPPNAIVLLSPLSLLPPGVAHPLWMVVNISLAILAPYLAARFFRPRDPFGVIVLPVLMFLCWGGVRTLTQFSLIALTLSMAAMVLAERRPAAGGAWLGFALIKPQVAVPVLLWSVFTRRWTTVLSALVTAGGLFAVFCLSVQAAPQEVIARYADILARYHTDEAILAGISELRPLIARLVTDVSTVDAIAGTISLALMAGICAAGFREGAVRKRVLYAAPPLVACWSLLTFYHLTYGFLILMPLMMLLTLNDAEPSKLRSGVFWLLQLGMMFDIPGLSRRAGLANTPLYSNVLLHADRALILTLLIGVIVLARRESR